MGFLAFPRLFFWSLQGSPSALPLRQLSRQGHGAAAGQSSLSHPREIPADDSQGKGHGGLCPAPGAPITPGPCALGQPVAMGGSAGMGQDGMGQSWGRAGCLCGWEMRLMGYSQEQFGLKTSYFHSWRYSGFPQLQGCCSGFTRPLLFFTESL